MFIILLRSFSIIDIVVETVFCCYFLKLLIKSEMDTDRLFVNKNAQNTQKNITKINII